MKLLSPNRFMLVDVPPVHFYEGGKRCPEDICFPSALRACLEYLGDSPGCAHTHEQGSGWELNCAYAYLMGTSGAAFFLSWQPGWRGDNGSIHYMSPQADAPFTRAFDSVGYPVELVRKKPHRDNESFFRQIIRKSLRDEGRPVLAFGVVGPPEPSIIAGWDDEGDVLMGWSFFQKMPPFNAGLEQEPCGYFRKRDWFGATEALAIMGKRSQHPPLREIYRDALRWGLKVARDPMPWPGRHNGLAAYRAWAEDLVSREFDFATDDLAELTRIHGAHDDVVGTLAEARWYGSLFLKQAAKDQPEMAEPLQKAAACFKDEHDLMWKVWDCVGGMGRSEKQIRALKERPVREKIVPIILQAHEKEFEALSHVEEALGIG